MASGVERRLADRAAGADPAEQRAGAALGHRLPGLEGAHGTGLGVPAARQAKLSPLSGPVRLAAADAQAQPVLRGQDILDLQRHQLGAAERGREADQQQGAVAPAAGGDVAGGDQVAQHGEGERRLPHRPAALAQQAFQWLLDVAVPEVPGQVVEAVHLADGGQAPAHRGGRVAVLEAGEVGADGRGRRGHRREAMRGAPGGVVRPVGLVGPQRRRRRGLAPQRPCRVQRRLAGGCSLRDERLIGCRQRGRERWRRAAGPRDPVGDGPWTAKLRDAAAKGKPNNYATRDNGHYRA